MIDVTTVKIFRLRDRMPEPNQFFLIVIRHPLGSDFLPAVLRKRCLPEDFAKNVSVFHKTGLGEDEIKEDLIEGWAKMFKNTPSYSLEMTLNTFND